MKRRENWSDQLNGTDNYSPPEGDEVELIIFGPGFGECCLVHLGSKRWIVVDSCIEPESQLPAALWYLNKIGQNPSEVISLIIASHWHDDHVRGLASIVETCAEARFCCSSALTANEFRASVLAYSEKEVQSSHPGPKEILKIYELLNCRNGQFARPIRAVPNRRIVLLDGSNFQHGHECCVWTLSPSDEQITRFLLEAASLTPFAGQTKRRIIMQGPNKTGVVVLVTVGPLAFLLGGDLEEDSDPTRGWKAIVSSEEREDVRASAFKIPHHGSENAHNDDVWAEMLIESPYAVLAPYNRGATKLPKHSDCERINELSSNAWSTASPQTRRSRKIRSKPVQKTVREVAHRFEMADPEFGWVRMRWNNPQSDSPTVTLSNTARTLRDLQSELATVGFGRSKG